MEKKCKKAKWLSGEALQIAVKRREGKNKGGGRCCSVERLLHKKVRKVKSCLTLCDPWTVALPGSLVHGIFQARVLEWVAISFSRGSS